MQKLEIESSYPSVNFFCRLVDAPNSSTFEMQIDTHSRLLYNAR